MTSTWPDRRGRHHPHRAAAARRSHPRHHRRAEWRQPGGAAAQVQAIACHRPPQLTHPAELRGAQLHGDRQDPQEVGQADAAAIAHGVHRRDRRASLLPMPIARAAGGGRGECLRCAGQEPSSVPIAY